MTRLLVSLATLAALSYGALFLLGVLVKRGFDWKGAQGPRLRLLWDEDNGGAMAVLLGDSTFSSYYVDCEKDTLWARLESLTGARVFPAALNGARTADLIESAQLVSRRWPPGTAAIVGVHPLRLFDDTPHWRPREFALSDELERLGASPLSASTTTRIDRFVVNAVTSNLFLVREKFALQQWFTSMGHKACWFGADPCRNRVWSLDGAWARERYARYLLSWRSGSLGESMEWLELLLDELTSHGLDGLVVLTPLNSELVASWSPAGEARALETALRTNHQRLLGFLDRVGAGYVDLFDKISSECFADMIHTNACGDDLIARAIAARLRASTPWLGQSRTRNR